MENIYYNYHKNKYPKLEKQDIIKLIYQGTQGPNHFISNPNKVLEYINLELKEKNNENENLYEYISDKYIRMNIFPYKNHFKEIETLQNMFINSSNINSNKDKLKENLLIYLNEKDLLNYDYKPISHSETYKTNYQPHYRLINSSFLNLEMKKIQLENFLNKQKENTIIALEGRCGSGKSTISNLFENNYTIIHIDDFFISKEDTNKHTQKNIYGNINYKLVYENLKIVKDAIRKKEKKIQIKAFSCETQEYYKKEIQLKNKIILEGTYSSSPYFKELIDSIAYLNIDKETQYERIKKRKISLRFFNEWIPLEEEYFKTNDIISICDIII